jgi:hypothetical protein
MEIDKNTIFPYFWATLYIYTSLQENDVQKYQQVYIIFLCMTTVDNDSLVYRYTLCTPGILGIFIVLPIFSGFLVNSQGFAIPKICRFSLEKNLSVQPF